MGRKYPSAYCRASLYYYQIKFYSIPNASRDKKEGKKSSFLEADGTPPNAAENFDRYDDTSLSEECLINQSAALPYF